MHQKYLYRVKWSEDDQEYVGLCAEFPSLSWLAPTQREALEGILAVVRDSVEDMIGNSEEPPEPVATKRFSGKFQIRVGPHLHRRLVEEAAEADMSLNRLVSEKLAR